MSTVDLAGARWRKSSRSGAEEGSDCVEVAFVGRMTDARWRKSSRSGAEEGSECVEVALVGARTAVRDSKNPGGPVLLLPESAFAALRKTV